MVAAKEQGVWRGYASHAPGAPLVAQPATMWRALGAGSQHEALENLRAITRSGTGQGRLDELCFHRPVSNMAIIARTCRPPTRDAINDVHVVDLHTAEWRGAVDVKEKTAWDSQEKIMINLVSG